MGTVFPGLSHVTSPGSALQSPAWTSGNLSLCVTRGGEKMDQPSAVVQSLPELLQHLHRSFSPSL